MMNVFLGIDGGATHSRAAVVGEDGALVAEFEGGALNFYADAESRVRRRLHSLVDDVRKGLPGARRLRGTVIGSAAVLEETRGDEKRRLCEGIGMLEDDKVMVVSDCLTALYGASSGKMGVLVIAGTGSVVVGRDAVGCFHRVGGWGHLFGDEGSAFWIGRQALAAAAAATDDGNGIADGEGQGARPLVAALCQWFDVRDFADVIAKVYHPEFSKSSLAKLAEYLAETLADNEFVLEIFRDAAAQLEHQVVRLLRKGSFSDVGVPLYLMGGVLEKNRVVEDALVGALLEHGLERQSASAPAHVGAALWARDRFLNQTV